MDVLRVLKIRSTPRVPDVHVTGKFRSGLEVEYEIKLPQDGFLVDVPSGLSLRCQRVRFEVGHRLLIRWRHRETDWVRPPEGVDVADRASLRNGQLDETEAV